MNDQLALGIIVGLGAMAMAAISLWRTPRNRVRWSRVTMDPTRVADSRGYQKLTEAK